MAAAAAQRLEVMETEAKAWIEKVLGCALGPGRLQPKLKSGVVLCDLANQLEPDVCKKPSASSQPFAQRENIGFYLVAATKLGVPNHDMFTTVDLFECRNGQAWVTVLVNLHSLGRVMQRRSGYSGPTLGVKLSSKNTRNFSTEKLQKAKSALTFLGGALRNSQAAIKLEGVPNTNRVQPTETTPRSFVAAATASAKAAFSAVGAPKTATTYEQMQVVPAKPEQSPEHSSSSSAAAASSASSMTHATEKAAEKAATRVQSSYRGHVARVEVATSVAETRAAEAAAAAKVAAEAAAEAKAATEAATKEAEAARRSAEERDRTARAEAAARAYETASAAAAEAHGLCASWITHAAAAEAAEAARADAMSIAKRAKLASGAAGVGDDATSAGEQRQVRPTVFNGRRHADLEAVLVEARGPRPRRTLPFSSWPITCGIRQLPAAGGDTTKRVALPVATRGLSASEKSRAPTSANLELHVSYHGLSMPREPPNGQQLDRLLRGVTGKHAACQPIAMLLCDTPARAQANGAPPLTLLATTEWHDQCESGCGTFTRLLGFDAAALTLGPNAKLRLQLRHVTDAFFDAVSERSTIEARLFAMPLMGEAVLSVAASLEAALRGEVLALTLLRPDLDPRTDPEDTIGGTALVRIRHALGLHLAKVHPAHMVANYLWRLHDSNGVLPTGSGTASAARAAPEFIPQQRLTPSRKRLTTSSSLPQLAHLDGLRALQQQQRWKAEGGRAGASELRMSEHLLPCAYGLLVPLATLAMLLEDAELCAAVSLNDGSISPAPQSPTKGLSTPTKGARSGGVRGGGGAPGALDAAEEAPLDALDAPDWSALALWIRNTHGALVDCANDLTLGPPATPQHPQPYERLASPRAADSKSAAVAQAAQDANAAAASVRMGFKPSSQRALPSLAPMPTNLGLSILEVLDDVRGGTTYTTVTLGAIAAHSLGFAAGGAEALGASDLATPQRSTPSGALSAAFGRIQAERVRHYAKRCVLLKCQGYAALAASFALSCQEAAARNDRTFFKACAGVGYLIQLESLLSTRGDEWAMLQDVSTAAMMMRRVRLTVIPDAEGGGTGGGESNRARTA